MLKAVLDTDMVSELFRGKDATVASNARDYLRSHGRFTITVVTVMEAIRGYSRLGRDDRVQQLLALFASVEVLPLDETAAELAGRIRGDLDRAGRAVDLPDLMVAAIALRHHMPVVTGNTRHFGRVQEAGYSLVLQNWRDR
jgi:tRNA(fMet)-specific endonuclease VapC